jgi:hypothetical protein
MLGLDAVTPFGFLGIDTLVERTGRLRRIERHQEALAGKATSPPAAGQVLRGARSSGWTR